MGPLAGIKVVELGSIGPAPMAAMLLADLGATVLRVERPGSSDLGMQRPRRYTPVLRGRRAVAVDLKSRPGADFVLRVVESADALIEPFRPGVAERLGLGPDTCLSRNPRLVYARMTGWGQRGELAHAAGHDLNYLALTGVLNAIGRAGQPPTPPLNLVGDYGGGSLYLCLGLLAGVLEARSSGRGQVIDVAMVDGVASLATLMYGMHAGGLWNPARGTNYLDGGAPYYDVYACADERWIAVAAIEDRFYERLLEGLGLDGSRLPARGDPESWPDLRRTFAKRFRARARDEWCAVFAPLDACVSPVLDFDEALANPHLREREVFVDVDGVSQPAPAPRFSRTGADAPSPPEPPRADDVHETLTGWLSETEIDALASNGVFA